MRPENPIPGIFSKLEYSAKSMALSLSGDVVEKAMYQFCAMALDVCEVALSTQSGLQGLLRIGVIYSEVNPLFAARSGP